MKRLLIGLSLAGLLLLSGCQAVNTTSPSAAGVERKQYMLSVLSAAEINQAYAQMYRNTLSEARGEGKLDTTSKQAKRLQQIGHHLIAEAPYFREDARQWQWEINLINSPELNASCGPGGKIIFYSGLINTLDLTDDEIAAVMGHEIAHALREHSREQMSKAYSIEIAKTGVAVLLGVDQSTIEMVNVAVNYGMLLPNSRSAEAEADLIGIELAARAGYDPNGAVHLWQKMEKTGGKGAIEFMSTHPASQTRIKNLQEAIPKVMPLYEQARK